MNLSAQEIARLHALPLFAGLSAGSLMDLLGDCAVRMHGKRKTLFLQGDPATHFFVVLSGWVKLFRLRPDGAEVVVEIFGPGESFAEGAMHMPEGYPVSAEMVEEGRLLAVPTAAFGQRVRQDPNLAISMLASMAVRLKELVNRIEKKETQTAAQRVADFLLKFGGPAPRKDAGTDAGTDAEPDAAHVVVQLPYDKQLIANRLGMKPETFSRALSTLRDQGVHVEGARAEIRDRFALRRFTASG